MIIKRGLGGGVPRHAHEASAAACANFNPIIQSAVGIVRESAGLVSSIASLGIALFVNTDLRRRRVPTSYRGRPTSSPSPRSAAQIICNEQT
jgi:hypothetical protein